MASRKELSPDACYAKLVDMFGESIDMETICEVGSSCKWDFSQCVEALLTYDAGTSAATSAKYTQGYVEPTLSYSERLKNGLNAPTAFVEQTHRDSSGFERNSHVDKLFHQISDGYKILVLLRGLPGSGKSTLARQLLNKAGLNPEDHIVSADHFFTDKFGNYNFNPSQVPEAHMQCQNRAKSMMRQNFAPIFIDNTNIRLWEMEFYCLNAVDHGYVVHILEPTTAWAKNPEECSRRNCHNVPFDTILNMRRTYERIQNGQELLDHFHLPKRIQFQLRKLPAIANTPELPEAAELEPIQCLSPLEDTDDIILESEEIVRPSPFENFNWAAHEREVSLFWQENLQAGEQQKFAEATEKKNQIHSTMAKPQPPTDLFTTMLSALKDDSSQGSGDVNIIPNAPQEQKPLERHRKECRNENEAFSDVRLAFPTVSLKYLWDLFEECRGDANWMMNILLNETADADNIPSGDADEDFTCYCDSTVADEVVTTIPPAAEQRTPLKTPRHRKKTSHQQKVDPKAEEIKRQIEASVKIGDEFYTENMKRVRDWKNKKKNPVPPAEQMATTATDDEDDDVDNEEVFEFRLGSEFINQLEGIFNTNSEGLDFHKFHPNVFMKRSLAKQIYHLWVESMMFQLEEQKFDTMKDDEEIARQINELDEMKRSAVQFSDVTQMASAMQAYVNNNDWANGGADLAVKLKRQKLYEIFPSISRSAIDEVLRENNDNYEQVVNTLNSLYEQSAEERLVEQHNSLILKAKIETERIPKQPTIIVNKPLPTGDAKRDALKEFEDNRNKAMHHYQFRQDCYQKAREASQKRNSDVAYYYLQIAKLHNHKVDHYNHLAANSIVNVHDLTHNNAELIDLHYLLVQEAIPCLEVFLDSWIIRLRQHKLPYKQLFIITGRGLHSVAGIPTIKVNVKTYLAKRGFRCVEVNPGLLRVKVYSCSRTSESTASTN